MSSPTESPAATALVSVHDLMPRTMPAVRRVLALLEQMDAGPVTLLVVPGSGWERAGVAELRALQRDGHVLAGHGWSHHAERFGGLYHRLHGLTLSRRVAEHLALDADGVIELINRCYRWFGDHALDAPALYVPPAWALGRVDMDALAAACPFRLYETFSGVIDAGARRFRPVPMLGYEADAALRIPFIRLWNGLNRRWAARQGVMRIGIHPFDPELHLRRDLVSDLRRYRRGADYQVLCDGPPPRLGRDTASA